MIVTNIKTFKSVFRGLSKICDEVKFRLDSDELYCSFLNRNHTIFCRAFIKCVNICDDEKNTTFVIDLYEFEKVLKNIKNSGELSIKLSDSYIDILYKNNNSKKNYRLGLLNSDGAESREPPTLNYDMLNIPLEFIKESLNDIKLVSTESCVFTIDEKWFLISIKEPTMMLMDYNNSIELDNLHENQKATYTINLLELFLEFKDISSELMVGFKTDHPLKLVISNNDALIEGVVAPRLEEDEDE